jgi:hypothetical protein
MQRYWTWCEDRAIGGWMLMIAVTVTTGMLLAVYVAGQTQAVMTSCNVHP